MSEKIQNVTVDCRYSISSKKQSSTHHHISIHKNYTTIKLIEILFPKGFEKLRVVNDTECHCVKIENLNSSRGKSLDQSKVNKPLPKCKCPSNFIQEIDAEGCHCNCSNDDIECKLRYEGKEDSH